MDAGRKFDRYVIESELGAGGMGRVYRALDTKLQRRVALKVLLTTGLEGPERDEAVARLLREARLAAALEHPNVVSVYDVGEADGTPYVAMELIRGHSLRRYVGDASIALEERTTWLLDVASALGAAHKSGLIHRDVKPENVMLREDGVIKVLDFGIARRSVSADGVTVDAAATDLQTLSQGGAIVGTPMYMAPEQIRGEALDGRCDQFAWGVMAYELLGGVSPWGGGDVLAILGKVLSAEPARLESLSPELAPPVAEAVHRSLARNPDERFASMGELASAIRGGPSSARVAPPPASNAGALLATERASATSVPLETIAPNGDAKRRRALALAGLGLAALCAVLFAQARKTESLGAVASAPSVASAAPSHGVAVTDLPLAEKPMPEAEKAYREGLQAFRSGLDTLAIEKLRKATELDPSFAAAKVQLVAELFWWGNQGARQPYLNAVQVRDKLTERDRALLSALEPIVLPEVADYKASAAAFERLAIAFPSDAQIALCRGSVIGLGGAMEQSVAGISRAIEFDPSFAAAMGLKGQFLAYLGRLDEAAKVTQECLRLSPNATECLQNSLWAAEGSGNRAAFSQNARATWLNGGDYSYPWFADALFLSGEARGAVLDALGHHWPTLPEANRGFREPRDRAALAVLDGELGSAASLLEAIDDKAIASEDPWRWVLVTALWLDVLEESGRALDAAKIATELRGRLAGLPANPGSEDWGLAEEPLPVLLEAQLRGGAISRAQYETARGEWLTRWRARASGYLGYVWLHGYAAHVETPDAAAEALAALPSFGKVPPFRPLTATNFDLGRMYLLAGQREQALDYLKRATQSSAAIEYPIALVRSRLFYGIALAESGDKAGACEAFDGVLTQWGKAKPRSVTAEEARKRATALGCASAR